MVLKKIFKDFLIQIYVKSSDRWAGPVSTPKSWFELTWNMFTRQGYILAVHTRRFLKIFSFGIIGRGMFWPEDSWFEQTRLLDTFVQRWWSFMQVISQACFIEFGQVASEEMSFKWIVDDGRTTDCQRS